jgi:hypothetical protein
MPASRPIKVLRTADRRIPSAPQGWPAAKELPVHTLRVQLEGAYLALETLDADRRRIRMELQATRAEAAKRLDEATARADEALSNAACDIRNLASERGALLAQIREIYSSTSWRVTRPLRGAMRVLRWIQALQAEMAGCSRGLGFHGKAANMLPAKPVSVAARREAVARPAPEYLFQRTSARA